MSADWEQAIEDLQNRLTYRFRDPRLLRLALTHTSFLQEHPTTLESNQRLEFLGDAVLQLILTHQLFELFPGEREGVLSRRRSILARGVFLSAMAREVGLPAALRLSATETSSGGRDRASTLEDAFEALVGAIFLDSDFGTAKRIVLSLYGPLPDRLASVEDLENPKGRLQELIQPTHGNGAVHYEVLQTTGMDHAREYEVAVYLLDRQLGVGRGSSKKTAEEAAARAALTLLAAAASAPAPAPASAPAPATPAGP